MPPSHAPAPLRILLALAGLYNLAFGVCAVFFPLAAFRLAGMEAPRYPELWQCIGMIVGVYGLAYAAAAVDPIRHWPVVAAGLAGKVFGPLGFVWYAYHGRLAWSLGWVILTNDVAWWVPFSLILLGAYRSHIHGLRLASPEIRKMALRARTQFGDSLIQLSTESPLLLVFLRHAGCTFCREALADLAQQRRAIEELGVRIALVHMGSGAEAERFFARYGLAGVCRVDDPGQNLYRAFGLSRGRLGQLFGPKVWFRGFQAGILGRHGIGRLAGDGFQMPGVFLLFHGEILNSFRHASAADRPDYVALASGSYSESLPS